MKKKSMIRFIQNELNINAPVTKFGGQPFWLEKPQWPLSRELGTQMQFICQIALEEKIFPGCGGRFAYLFMTDDENVFDTFDPDTGENAVIIQPGGRAMVSVTDMATGPTLQAQVNYEEPAKIQPKEINWAVDLIDAEDPEFLPQEVVWELSEEEQEARRAATGGNKIGGIPDFLQNDEFPDNDLSWRLLLQLHSAEDKPFSINFGDAGTGYAFINEDASEGKFLWQCC